MVRRFGMVQVGEVGSGWGVHHIIWLVWKYVENFVEIHQDLAELWRFEVERVYYMQWRSPIQVLTFHDNHNFYLLEYQCPSGLVVRVLAHFSHDLCVMSSNPQWVWTCWRWGEEYFETARGLGVTCFFQNEWKGLPPRRPARALGIGGPLNTQSLGA